jgi:alkanesulfonate monooxygenase SsuD/methylene tetrahydromethanopterin reductase-like flavin-dependent oxidoreductase (luciferase family)
MTNTNPGPPAYIGAKTDRILLGTLATDCIRRHPASIAHVLATLDNLTQGGAVLGIGTGEAMNIVPYGLPWEAPDCRVSRLEETVRIMRWLRRRFLGISRLFPIVRRNLWSFHAHIALSNLDCRSGFDLQSPP